MWKRWICLAWLLLIPFTGNAAMPTVAAGYGHTVALKQPGTASAWGRNDFGQLGDGTTINRSTPVQVLGLIGVTAIAAGGDHTLAVKQDGTVWAWGVSEIGQLGDGTFHGYVEPVLVVNESLDGFLDLVPEIPNNIPPEKIPPFFLETYKSGESNETSLSADIRGITTIGTFASATGVGPLAAGGYNVYVAAAVPYSGAYLYYQLDSNNYWSALTWPMSDFMRGVELGSQDTLIRVNILQNVDLRPYVGTSILVGYGTDPDEMVSNARYRTIFTVTPPQ